MVSMAMETSAGLSSASVVNVGPAVALGSMTTEEEGIGSAKSKSAIVLFLVMAVLGL